MMRPNRTVTRKFARVLTAVTILALPAAATFGYAPAAASPGNAPVLQGFTFTPELTSIDFTVTPEATAINTVDPGPTPTTDEQSEDEDVELELGGGDWEVGYDFVETEDGGQWHIWHNGEVLIVDATDPELGALLSAFREQAVIREQAKADLEAAGGDIINGIAGTLAGVVVAGGSVAVAVPSCGTTPLTFWAGGGTGWICAGSVLTAIGGGSLIGVSFNQTTQGFSNQSDARKRYRNSSDEVEELFDSIIENSGKQ
jgi:hypothetical protein